MTRSEGDSKILSTLIRKQAIMAGRILNRRELRKQADQAAQTAQPEGAAPGVASGAALPEAPTKSKAKTPPATPKARKTRTKKAPPRMRARWGVFDGGMKQVAIFDYNQRAAAEEKLADLVSKKKGVHFLQIVKEPMAEPAPVDAPPPA
jgi:hypothetical protein